MFEGKSYNNKQVVATEKISFIGSFVRFAYSHVLQRQIIKNYSKNQACFLSIII